MEVCRALWLHTFGCGVGEFVTKKQDGGDLCVIGNPVDALSGFAEAPKS